MVPDRAGTENHRIGANPNALTDPNVAARQRNRRRPVLQLGIVVMGARNQRDVMAGKAVVPYINLPRRQIEQGIHHFGGGSQVQSFPIAKDPDFGVDDRLNGGAELLLAETIGQFCLLGRRDRLKLRDHDRFDDRGETGNQRSPKLLLEAGFILLKHIHNGDGPNEAGDRCGATEGRILIGQKLGTRALILHNDTTSIGPNSGFTRRRE
jgi:hypothetical protein